MVLFTSEDAEGSQRRVFIDDDVGLVSLLSNSKVLFVWVSLNTNTKKLQHLKISIERTENPYWGVTQCCCCVWPPETCIIHTFCFQMRLKSVRRQQLRGHALNSVFEQMQISPSWTRLEPQRGFSPTWHVRQTPYRDGADSSSAAGAEVSLLLGGNIQQDKQVSCYKDQSSVIKQLQVSPSPTVVTEGVTGCRRN